VIALIVLGAVGYLLVLEARGSRRRDASFAGRRGASELLIDRDHPGRLVLGRLAGPRWRARRLRLAAPNGASVLVIGPTQSGKTSSIVVPALLSWEGPVLAASVKDDLVRETAAWRRRAAEVGILDPGTPDRPLSVRFDPVAMAGDWRGARRIARALCEAGPGELAGSDASFWGQLASKLLAPLLRAAALEGDGIEQVGRWLDERSFASPLDRLLDAGEEAAARSLQASVDREDRQLSSVLATLESTLVPLIADQVLATPVIDPGRLLAAGATLFLCAPAHDQRRQRPLFTAVVQQVIEEAFELARRQGGCLERPLLVVLDEAAAIAPLAELDVLAATCASHGITLVTCFQDLAQLRARYGERAATVVNNHTTRVLLAGLADVAAGELLGSLAGTAREESDRRARPSAGSLERRALIEPHELRQLPAHSAVVISGRLRPVRIRLVPWWRQAGLADRGPSAPEALRSARWRRSIRRGP
jgi:type IV secretory pathway TraG/TraD family ATPase VirD4